MYSHEENVTYTEFKILPNDQNATKICRSFCLYKINKNMKNTGIKFWPHVPLKNSYVKFN